MRNNKIKRTFRAIGRSPMLLIALTLLGLGVIALLVYGYYYKRSKSANPLTSGSGSGGSATPSAMESFINRISGISPTPSATPTAPSPTPTAPSPTPTAPSPTPTAPSPTPTAPSPTPTAPSPTPTAPSPTPTVSYPMTLVRLTGGVWNVTKNDGSTFPSPTFATVRFVIDGNDNFFSTYNLVRINTNHTLEFSTPYPAIPSGAEVYCKFDNGSSWIETNRIIAP